MIVMKIHKRERSSMRKIAFVLILCFLLSACARSQPSAATPDYSLILDSFEIEGPVYDMNTKTTYVPEGHDIIIRVPDTLIQEGFHMQIVGNLPEGGQEVLYTEADAVPGGRLVISAQVHSAYTQLHISLDYSQGGSYVCYSNINLFTGAYYQFVPVRSER